MSGAVELHGEPSAAGPERVEGLTVVGIGASAGGLKALQLFFEAVTADSGMAYVVIMHLHPKRTTRIAALLQDRAAIPVIQVTTTMPVERDHVYIIPPGFDLEMEVGTIRVVAREDRPQHTPVDLFFRTLAGAYGADAIGVVLSGTGDDGTAGIRHIKECGGITVAQSPDEAEYAGMPSSAIATGLVELVLASGRIPGVLLRVRRMPSPLPYDTAPADREGLLAQVFSELRQRTGHDFSQYKRATVLRRLERRLRFNEAETLEDYLTLLRASDTESGALVRDLLISVSGFFRDPEAFAALESVVPALFADKGQEAAVRVWVVGCATGEEVYSIAILLHEHAATLEHAPQIQIFATDIDTKGHACGRAAFYPASAMGEMPEELLRRYFTREAGGFRVVKSLRECVLFAVHNVLHDPPFSRLDLISCRNLLIYLQPEAQERVIDTFHYALRTGGYAFLGAAESIGQSRRFVAVSEAQRLYRRDDAQHPVPPRPSAMDPSPPLTRPAGDSAESSTRKPFSYGSRHLRMLEVYSPPSLIVDEKLNVVHRSPTAGELLHLGEGEPSHNLLDLSRGDLRLKLRTALYQAFQNGLPSSRPFHLDGNGGHPMKLRVHPQVEDATGEKFALVIFEESLEDRAGRPVDTADRGALAEMEEELQRTNEQLEATSAAHDHTVAELQAANEELQSINEEEKAASEELETSREEIQSINEELITINQEHQSTIEELRRTNADLQNLIESTEIGTIFLDRGMRVRRFTPSVTALFNFISTDQGRPLAHITHRLEYPGLIDDVRRVLSAQERIEREVSSDDGLWYLARTNPYRSHDGGIEGAVVTFVDTTAQKRVQEELREAKLIADSATRAKGAFLATLSHEFRTPLNAMLGYAEILELDGPLTAGQVEKIARIKAGGWLLASMIDEILSFAKLDEGGVALRFEQLDARAVARETVAQADVVARAKGLAFVLDLPDEAIPLETDRGKAVQVLINLCGNAIKYTQRGEVRLRVLAVGEQVVFEVHDTGIGIAPEDQPHVFERFWQVDSATTRSFGGMGIGLAAARELSRLLGGDIEVESEIGVGSTFRVRLPRQRDQR
jgi:two-component system, chemotaxis family, CheB/CheR fusion protein